MESIRGSFTLREYPGARVTVVCDPCGRRGVYRTATLAARHGAEIRLPDLLQRLSADCPSRQAPGLRTCHAVFAELQAQKKPGPGTP